ncbi:16592_t:CDS:1, partial [Gigaspora margarita]
KEHLMEFHLRVILYRELSVDQDINVCYIELDMKCKDRDFDKQPTAIEIIDNYSLINLEDNNEIKSNFLKV